MVAALEEVIALAHLAGAEVEEHDHPRGGEAQEAAGVEERGEIPARLPGPAHQPEQERQQRPDQAFGGEQRPLAPEVAPELLVELHRQRGAAHEHVHLAVLLALQQVAQVVPVGGVALVDGRMLGGADRQVGVGRVAHHHEEQSEGEDPSLARAPREQRQRHPDRPQREQGGPAVEGRVAERRPQADHRRHRPSGDHPAVQLLLPGVADEHQRREHQDPARHLLEALDHEQDG